MAYIKKLKNNELIGGTDNTDVYPITSTKAVFDENNVSQDYLNKHITGDRIESNTISGDKLADKALTEEKVSDALMDKINSAAHGVTEEFETEVREALDELMQSTQKAVNTVSINNDTPLQPDVNKNINITVPEDLKDLNEDSEHKVVTDTEKSTWNGKQDALTFDSVPTANSDNPVKSGGVYQAIQDIDVSSQISGKADKSEMSVVAGTGANADKTTITLKSGTSATVLTQHQDVSEFLREGEVFGSGGDSAASFNSYADTVWNKQQTLSESQKQQVRENIGIADLETIRNGAAAGATAIQSVTVGTTTTGAAGSSASVVNSGTATAPVLDFTIPQGAQGVKGDTVIMGNEDTYTLYNTTGDAVDGAMTQQAVTREFAELAGDIYDIQREDTPSEIDLSSNLVQAWIGSNGNFSTVTGQQCTIIPTDGYKKLSITANANNNCFFLLLKTYPTISNNASYSTYLCNGETGRRTQAAGATEIYNLPNDCAYVMIGITSSSKEPQAYKPSSASFLGGRIISRTNRIERLEEAALYRPSSEYTAINIKQRGSQIQSWLNSNGKWDLNNTQSSYVIDVRNYRNLRITSNAELSTIFAFCNSLPVVPSTSTSYAAYLCSGETGRRTQVAGTTVEYVLPSDCQYIVIGDKSTTMADTYLPDLFELAYDSDTLLPITDLLEAKISKIDTDLHTIKILSIGNSFSRDALSYVPMILKELGINATIGILYHSSCSLQSHWENRESSSFYTLDYFNWSNGKWTQVSSVGLDNGLSYDNWDIVTFQQNSSNSMDYSTCQPYLDNLISYVSGKLHNIKIGWLLTHAWADGYSGLSSRNITSDQMAALVRTTTESVMKNAGVDILIPYGTAVQLARGNENLAQLGTFGEMSYDGVHLQEGIGCLIASYVSAKVISEVVGTKTGIHGNEVEPNASFLSTYVIPEQHGSSVGVSDENLLLGQKYAVQAYNNPLTILADN